MVKEKDVSTRLIRPVISEVNVNEMLHFVHDWDNRWETDGSVRIFDEGIAQYMLVDVESHYKFFAALILGKPSLRCQLMKDEPVDELDEAGNKLRIVVNGVLPSEDEQCLQYLQQILEKRGFHFEYDTPGKKNGH